MLVNTYTFCVNYLTNHGDWLSVLTHFPSSKEMCVCYLKLGYELFFFLLPIYIHFLVRHHINFAFEKPVLLTEKYIEEYYVRGLYSCNTLDLYLGKAG